MSRYNIDITEPAEYDLSQIGKYISEELLEPQLASKVIDKIASTIFSLEEMPSRHALVRDERLAQQGIRKIMMDNYIVFYIISEEIKTVTIIRILYSRRDWINLL